MIFSSQTCFTPGEKIIKKLPDISQHSPVTQSTPWLPRLSGCYVQQHHNIRHTLGDGFGERAIGDRLLKPCYLSREDDNWKIRTRKQITDVGKYSFVNRTIKSWNQLLAGLLASFPCKKTCLERGLINTLERGLRMQLQTREFD